MDADSSPAVMRALLPKFKRALELFASSSQPFQIVHSLTALPLSGPSPPPPSTLLILDSSFNPPTLAHHHIAHSALTSAFTTTAPSQTRLLLLLATKNADKAPQPASFEHRLVMMALLAHDLLAATPTTPSSRTPDFGIDIALTSLPYFHHKSGALQSHPFYATATQTHLIGFDTLVRILDPKYYDPHKQLSELDDFLGKHKLRVVKRAEDGRGEAEQEEWVRGVGEGSLDTVGGRRQWVDRIEVVEPRTRKDAEGEGGISSTKVREAVGRGDDEALKALLTDGVREWVVSQGLYGK